MGVVASAIKSQATNSLYRDGKVEILRKTAITRNSWPEITPLIVKRCEDGKIQLERGRYLRSVAKRSILDAGPGVWIAVVGSKA